MALAIVSTFDLICPYCDECVPASDGSFIWEIHCAHPETALCSECLHIVSVPTRVGGSAIQFRKPPIEES